MPAFFWYPFCFVPAPFLCLVSIWNSLSVVVHQVGCVGFLWCSVSFGVGSFLGHFLLLHVRVAFALLLQLVVLRISGSLCIGASHSAEFMVLPGISPFFLFLGFRALPLSWVGLVPLFLLQAVVYNLSAFFSVGAPFFFILGLPSGSLSSPSSESSLGLLCRAFVFWPVCPSFVLPCGCPPGCFFGGFPPLPVIVSTFSPVAWSPSVVSCCCLPLSPRPLPAVVAIVFPSGLFRFLPYFLARSMSGALSLLLLCFVRSWGRFEASLRLLSFCDLFVLFLFSYSCSFSSLLYGCSFRVSSGSFSSSFSSCPPFLHSGFLCG